MIVSSEAILANKPLNLCNELFMHTIHCGHVKEGTTKSHKVMEVEILWACYETTTQHH